MSSYTENLNLFKYNVTDDANVPFNITTCLNDNWDKLDTLGTSKQDKLVSGTNIKTINNTSLLGSGNISIAAPSIYLKTCYVNGTSGYNIWSNGYCEQWGLSKTATVTFLKTFADTNYNITCAINGYNSSSTSVHYGWVSQYVGGITSKTTTSVTFYGSDSIRSNYPKEWKVSGYLAKGEY